MAISISDDVSKVFLGDQTLYDRDGEWKTLTGNSEFYASFVAVYKINRMGKYIDLLITGETHQLIETTSNSHPVIADFSALIHNITKVEMSITDPHISNFQAATVEVISGTAKIRILTFWDGFSVGTIGYSTPENSSRFARIYYDKLI